MANSVEGRFPFLDYRVIEFCNSLPPEFKLRGLNEKYILKKMMKDRLPADIIKRTKQPYRAPVASGLLTGNSLLDELTSEHEIKKTGIFDHIAVNKLLEKLRSGIPATENENMALSGIISTQLLIHQFIYKNTKELKDIEVPASTTTPTDVEVPASTATPKDVEAPASTITPKDVEAPASTTTILKI